MENLGFPAALQNTKVLVMSYANMKPQSPQVHQQLAAWVQKGGTLLYYGRDNDPFQKVQEWWNTNGLHYAAPSEHLFKQMNITPNNHDSVYHYGRGTVYIIRKDPKELVLTPGADSAFFSLIKSAYEASSHTKLITKNYFYLAGQGARVHV